MMGDWKPEVYDIGVDDVPEHTQEFFNEKAPEKISPMRFSEFRDMIDPQSEIEYHCVLDAHIEKLLSQHEPFRIPNILEQSHMKFASDYSFSIPTEEALSLLSDYSPVIELFAGNGYWAYEIQQFGGTVTAYDANPPHNTWTDVQKGSQDSLLHHAENDNEEISLLLSWPPVGEAAYDALLIARPDNVFYVGEHPDEGFKIMADEKFFKILDSRYELKESIELPSIQPAMDNLHHYTK